MNYRRFAWALGTVLVAAGVPLPAQADPSVPPGQPVKCLTASPKKQVLVPCDLLNAGANFPPGYRCPPPLEQYTEDVQAWCGVGPGLGVTPPGAPVPVPPPTSPTSPTSATSPTSPTKPTSPNSPTPSSPTPSSPTPNPSSPTPTSPSPSPGSPTPAH